VNVLYPEIAKVRPGSSSPPWHEAIGYAAGGASTFGDRGPWPLPAEALVLTFRIGRPFDRKRGEPGAHAGCLVVDLSGRTAVWTPVC
jgi:hypothetical protein